MADGSKRQNTKNEIIIFLTSGSKPSCFWCILIFVSLLHKSGQKWQKEASDIRPAHYNGKRKQQPFHRQIEARPIACWQLTRAEGSKSNSQSYRTYQLCNLEYISECRIKILLFFYVICSNYEFFIQASYLFRSIKAHTLYYSLY